MAEDFATRIKAAREAAGMSMMDAHEASGVATSAISYFERREREPSWSSVIALADTYGVSLDYLAGRIPATNPWIKARKAKGWSTREAAEAACVSASLVSRIEHGREISATAAVALARAYGVTVDAMFPPSEPGQ